MPLDYTGKLILIGQAPFSTTHRSATATRIRNLPKSPLREKLMVWNKRLVSAASPVPALDAYTGDWWQQLKDGFSASQIAEKHFFAASPGLGIIPSSSPVPNYSATFSQNHEDRIGNNDDETQKWWEELNGIQGRNTDLPAGVLGLIRQFPEATFLLVLSNSALSAMQADVWEAHASISDKERFLVFASGPPVSFNLGNSLIKVASRWEQLLGGPRHHVAARMANRILSEFTQKELRATHLQNWIKHSARRLPEAIARAKAQSNRKLSTLELETFVRRELAGNARLKPAGLKRILKNSGRTCDARLLEVFYVRHALPLLPK